MFEIPPAGSALYRRPRRRRRARIAALGSLLAVVVLLAMIGVSARNVTVASRGRLFDHASGTSAAARAAGGSAAGRAGESLAGGSPPQTLPFPPDPTDRRPHPREVPSLYDDGFVCSVGCRPYGAEFGWPLKPFHRQHPIRAGLNELRPGSLHVAVDIQATDGADVYAVQPGIAKVLEAYGPNARVEVGNYVYWHIDPRVASGQLVEPFKTVIGNVMNGYGHVAFSELEFNTPAGTYVNPLRPGGSVLSPYVNHRPPVIGPPNVAPDGQVTVAAYSPQSFVRRTTYITPVLAPAGLAYRLYDRRGRPVTPLEWSFRGTHLLPWALRSLIYAPGAGSPGYDCFATRSVCKPEWVYRVAGGLAPPLPTWLHAGRYRLTIYAWDWANNVTALDTHVRLTAAGWRPVGHFPKILFKIPGYYTQGQLLPPIAPARPPAPAAAAGTPASPRTGAGSVPTPPGYTPNNPSHTPTPTTSRAPAGT